MPVTADWPREQLNSPAPGQELHYENDHRNHQEQMDEPAGDIADQPENPENEKHCNDCPKHTK